MSEAETETIETPVDDDLADELESQSYPVHSGDTLADDDSDEGSAAVADEVPGDEDEAPATDVVSGISAELAQQAERYGLDPTAFGNDANLTKAMTQIDRQMAQFVRQPPQQAPQQRQEQKPAEEAKPAFEKLDIKAILGNVDDFEPAFVKAFDGLNDHYAGHIEKLQTQLDKVSKALPQVEQFGQFVQQQEDQQFASEMDNFFGSLGDEWAATFGKGGIGEVKPELAQKRLEVKAEMEVLAYGDHHFGRKPSTNKELAQRALRSKFGDTIETTVRNNIKAKVKKVQSAPLARPSAKTGAPADPRSRMIQRANEVYRKAGYVIPDDDGDDE